MRNTSSRRTSIVEAECVRINDEGCGGPSEHERQRTGGDGGDCHVVDSLFILASLKWIFISTPWRNSRRKHNATICLAPSHWPSFFGQIRLSIDCERV
jgi:hypothetical protein